MTNQPNQPKMDQSKAGSSRSDQQNPNQPQKTFGQSERPQDRSQADRDLKPGQPKRSA